MEIIKKGDNIISIVYRENEWTKGLNFFTPDSLFIQAGSWCYSAGTELAAHEHKICPRETVKTHELIYIKKGAIKVTLFDNERCFHKEFILRAGDTAVMVDGGHGYTILEDDTEVLEVKNGPFISVEKDKERF